MPREAKQKAKKEQIFRHSLLDYLNQVGKETRVNKFCKREDLNDEATVENFFIIRLLKDLGYSDAEIKPKKSLDEIVVARGRKKELYKPDYAIVCSDKPRWIIDGKATDKNVDDWAYQGAGYALGINKKYKNENPCQFYVLTNGLVLKVFKWDEEEPILTLEFSDFTDDNQKFMDLQALLGAKIVCQGWVKQGVKPETIILKKLSVEEIKKLFKACHDQIWKAEKMNPQPAFYEFVKIMFVKLLEDRKLHEDPNWGPRLVAGQEIPKDRIVFGTHWIEALEQKGVKNPIDTVLFRELSQALKEAVRRGEKKPIFEEDEHIKLQPETIKQVVGRLETYDLFGVDEDLNGRLFETFLSAIMRGKALGQYFTPRSIVKLMVKLADPIVNRDRMDKMLDACCGTGGFLIEALTEMRNQIRSNASLTRKEKEELLDKLANKSLYGIDAGREPPLARIARINMYLHGDGGARIYAADSLDKTVQTGIGDDPQSKSELEELRSLLLQIIKDPSIGFDIVLTNPPFSMDYSEKLDNEKKILKQYELTTYKYAGTSKSRPSLRSSIMFVEQHGKLLKPHGKLITVIDDSILGGRKYAFARDFIREHFVVRAVISLPGDAFQRVGARAKTSILYLVKREPGETGQPDLFMYECQYVGLDDVPMKTRPSKAQKAQEKAKAEIDQVAKAFREFLAGRSGPWLVPAEKIADRLDVKFCLPRAQNIEEEWSQKGYEVVRLDDIVKHVTKGGFNPKKFPEKEFTTLRVRYDGITQRGDTILGKELTYNEVFHPKQGDIVVSNIAVAHGSTGVILKDLKDVIISPEFTLLRMKDARFDRWFLWGYLRSAEVRARLLSKATGISRHRAGWEVLKDIPVPVVPKDVQKQIGKRWRESVNSIKKAERMRKETIAKLNSLLNLENEWAMQRLKAAKPPK